MEEDRILKKLEEIQGAQAKTNVIIEQIKGDRRLQNQVLSFHIDQLKAYKEDTDEKIVDLFKRIHILEKWQARIAGIAALAAVVFGLFVDNLKEALFGR